MLKIQRAKRKKTHLTYGMNLISFELNNYNTAEKQSIETVLLNSPQTLSQASPAAKIHVIIYCRPREEISGASPKYNKLR